MIAPSEKSKETTLTDGGKPVAANSEIRRLGVLAEFSSPQELIEAAKRLKEAGFSKLEAFTPFPIHGIDGILGIKKTPLPWFALAAGVIGGVTALAFQWWTNAIDYPYIVSGKPIFSLPANIPVTFEVVILLAALATFFGMLMLNGLPRLSNPLLRNESFRRVTDDGFFLMVEADDERYANNTAELLLDITPASHVEEVEDTSVEAPVPRVLKLSAAVLCSLALIPPLMVAKARVTTSDKPRIHNFFDMDFQPKFKSQTTSSLFADGRAARPRVQGTIPRGSSLLEDERFVYGIEPETQDKTDTTTIEVTVERAGQEATDPVGGSGQAKESPTAETDQEPAAPTTLPNYVERVPMEANEALLREGRTQFNIHCAVCHGKAGYGNGLASQRALELEQGTWVPPTSLHSPHLFEQPDGQLFNSITNGVRKMPAYGHQIAPRERWAIVAYMRALQRSQKASIDDVPEDYRPTLREFN